MSDLEKIRIPAIKVIKISDNRVIHIGDQIFGTLVIKLLNEDGDFVEGCDIQIPEYCGEECFITVPKTWIGKQVMVKYEREVMAKKLGCVHEKWPESVKLSGSFTNNKHDFYELTIDYAPDDTYIYYFSTE